MSYPRHKYVCCIFWTVNNLGFMIKLYGMIHFLIEQYNVTYTIVDKMCICIQYIPRNDTQGSQFIVFCRGFCGDVV